MKKWMTYLSVLLTSLFTACQNQTVMSKKKILKLNFSKIPPTFDPRKGGDPYSSSFQFMLFDGLTGLDKNGSSALSLAEEVIPSSNFTQYVFKLKKAFWSNGEPITAYHIEKTWKDILSPDFPCPNSHLFFSIKNAQKAKKGLVSDDLIGIYATNDQTLVVELEHPNPYFLEMTSFCAFFPVYSDKNRQDLDFYDSSHFDFPVSGAFKIAHWKPGYEMLLVKNPYYHRADQIKIDEIKISFISDESTAFRLFENREIDIIGGFFGDIPIEESQTLIEQNRLEAPPVGATCFCSFNLESYPFHNYWIRKAFASAINRDEIVKNILQHGETIAYGCIPPFMKKGDLPQDAYQGNREMAQFYFNKGLEELGLSIESFPEIIFTLDNSILNKQIALAIQNQIVDTLGVSIKLEQLDFKVYLDKINSKKHHMAYCTLIIQYNDIMNILERFRQKTLPKNYSNFEDFRFNTLLDQSSESDQIEYRLPLFIEAEKILVDQIAILGIYHMNFVYAKHDYIKGFYVSPIGSIHVNFVSID